MTQSKSHLRLRALCEGAIFIALAQVLSYLKLFELPQGGSITIEMLPIFLYCARWGFGPGMLASFAYSILQAVLSSTYAWTWQSLIGDYLLAFTVLGSCRLRARSSRAASSIGTVVGSVARFLVHYVVGATIWAEYMPETFFGLTMTSPWFYSALYNGSFMLIDMVLVLIVGALLWKPLKKYITGEDLRGAASAKNVG
ncbi:MAG: energy-coupled thiamine transporter ThiT [Oscillospiraceae bacterium]